MKYPDVSEHRMSQGFAQVNLHSSFELLHYYHFPFSNLKLQLCKSKNRSKVNLAYAGRTSATWLS